MTMADVMEALLHECPNGVSFDPMALRLLRKKVLLEDGQIEELKDEMFQLGEGLWFSRNMISGNETQLVLREQSEKWLKEYDCFSVERLFERYRGVFHHILTPEHFAIFLRNLGFSVAEYGKGGFYCFESTSSLGECLASITKTITKCQEDADGMLALNEIEELLPYMTVEALEDIRIKFLPEIHVEEIGDVPFWRSAEAVHLPEDFTEKLTDAVDTLLELGKKVDTGHLEFALDLFYRIRFREAYSLSNRRVFMSTCAKHYKGALVNKKDFSREFVRDWAKHHVDIQILHPTDVDSPSITNGSSVRLRQRSPNTNFDSLGVPLGAKLVFAKGSHIACTVIDPINQVEYDGKPWAISKLAMHLLNGVVTNGFAHFRYEGEILLERRSRLEREDRHSGVSLAMTPPSSVDASKAEGSTMEDLSDVSEDECSANCWCNMNSKYISSSESETQSKKNDCLAEEIIGLEGRPLKPDTWRAFRTAGTDPRVAEWVQRVENGERVEDVADESGYVVSTMKNMISGFKLYFKVCELNNIVPEDSTDV